MKINYILFLTFFCCLVACNNQSPQNNNPAETTNKEQEATTGNKNDGQANQTSPNSDPPYIITIRQVGPIKIGMPVAELKRIIYKENIKEVAITREGTGTSAYEIRLDPDTKEADLLVEEKCEQTCQVWRLHVKSEIIKTAEGLGIGSTLGEVKRFYKINFIGLGETEIVAVSEKSKITFLLDASKLPEKTIPKLNIANTSDSVKVIGMFII